MWAEWLPAIVTIVLFMGAVATAAMYIKSSVVRSNHEETMNLAKTRGETIEDLTKRLEATERKLAAMQGQIDALTALKADMIADAVVARLHSQEKTWG